MHARIFVREVDLAPPTEVVVLRTLQSLTGIVGALIAAICKRPCRDLFHVVLSRRYNLTG